MGTTLTGTTPQDTYDSLIKVTDNGPLTGSLKKLTDGLGNDSSLSLSTTAASLSGTLAVTGNVTIDTTTLVVDAAGDRVIMGAAAAVQGDSLEVHAKTNAGAISIFGRASDNLSIIAFRANGATTQKAAVSGGDTGLGFITGTTQRVLIDTSGNVGIGTSSPSNFLHIYDPNSAVSGAQLTLEGRATGYGAGVVFSSRVDNALGALVPMAKITGDGEDSWTSTSSTQDGGLRFFTATNGTLTEKVRILSSGGITFNGDTAAANALDDYEEGTFTATMLGVGSNPTTPVTTTGYYTKIGRQVNVNAYFSGSNNTGASGTVVISGLPFTSNSGISLTTGSASANLFDFAGGTSLQCYVSASQTVVEFLVSADDTAWINLAHTAGTGRALSFSVTYFV